MLNIAICDDMAKFRNDIECIIHKYEKEKGASFRLIFFESGEELTEKFDEDNFFIDIFFIDYYMRELNGVQAALHIREKNPKCKIVFVTSAVPGNLYEFMQVSPLGILSKPVKEEKTFQVLDKAMINETPTDRLLDFSWPIM